MKPKISIVTLGVDDLERATRFYGEGLGLPRYEFEGGNISFFSLKGTWLALYPRDELAKDIGLAAPNQGGFSGMTLAHNVASKTEVDAVLDQAVSAGARLVKPAKEVFWGGYSGLLSRSGRSLLGSGLQPLSGSDVTAGSGAPQRLHHCCHSGRGH